MKTGCSWLKRSKKKKLILKN